MAKVLIIEDSLELQEMYHLIFKIRNITCNTVSKRQELMRQLILNRPDIILMDVMLGSEDGREICRELKKHTDFKDIPMVLISASPEKLKDYQDCLADDILEKPFSIDALIDKINALLKVDEKLNQLDKPDYSKEKSGQ